MKKEFVGRGALERLISLIKTNKQDKTDKSLKTEDKNIVGAINEVNSGLVKEMGSSVNEETNELTVELKDKSGKVIASTKVVIPKGEVPDLSAYVKNTDLAQPKQAGLISGEGKYGARIMNNNDGHLAGIPRTLEQYAGLHGSYFISKATLENILYDYVRRGITTNTETWTDDETQAARDLIGAVGKGDFPTNDGKNAGIVNVHAGGVSGIDIDPITHVIKIYPGAKQLFPVRHQSTYARHFAPLVMQLIDDIVAAGLGDCQKPELWTDDSTDENGEVVKGTKTKALELLGALSRTPPPTKNGGALIMAWDNDYKTPISLRVYSSYLTPYSVAMRDAYKVLHGGMPTTATGLTPKDYVDNLPDNLTLTDDERAKWADFVGALQKPTNNNNKTSAICLDKNGNVVLQVAESNQSANTIPISDGYGRLRTASAFVSNVIKGFHALQANDLLIVPDHLTLTDEQKAKWRAWLGIE